MGHYLNLLRIKDISLMQSPIIRKSKVYIHHGDKPPKWATIRQGPDGGFYYESGEKVHGAQKFDRSKALEERKQYLMRFKDVRHSVSQKLKPEDVPADLLEKLHKVNQITEHSPVSHDWVTTKINAYTGYEDDDKVELLNSLIAKRLLENIDTDQPTQDLQLKFHTNTHYNQQYDNFEMSAREITNNLASIQFLLEKIQKKEKSNKFSPLISKLNEHYERTKETPNIFSDLRRASSDLLPKNIADIAISQIRETVEPDFDYGFNQNSENISQTSSTVVKLFPEVATKSAKIALNSVMESLDLGADNIVRDKSTGTPLTNHEIDSKIIDALHPLFIESINKKTTAATVYNIARQLENIGINKTLFRHELINLPGNQRNTLPDDIKPFILYMSKNKKVIVQIPGEDYVPEPMGLDEARYEALDNVLINTYDEDDDYVPDETEEEESGMDELEFDDDDDDELK